MRRLTAGLVGIALSASTVLFPVVAGAETSGGGVSCNQELGVCVLTATRPGDPAGAVPVAANSPVPAAPGAPSCHYPTGEPAACSLPLLGWFNSVDGCYYKAGSAPPSGSAEAGRLGTHPPGSGAYYVQTCSMEIGRLGTIAPMSALVWRAAPPAGSPRLPSPAQLAQLAVSRLALTGPAVQLAPPAAGVVVGVPVWIWTDSAGWSGRSATAAVPGESVTATARPVSTVYTLGDGAQVVCTGPGTRWSAAAAAASPGYVSPTCGYTYLHSSASAPGGVFVLSASTSWRVSWAGGGQRGALSMTTRSAPVRVRVADAEALNTTGSSG